MKKNASLSIQILPLGSSEKSSLKLIDSVITLIKKSGIVYEVGPLETVMEGNLNELLKILTKIEHLVAKTSSGTVFSNIKIIYSEKGVMTIDEKVAKHR